VRHRVLIQKLRAANVPHLPMPAILHGASIGKVSPDERVLRAFPALDPTENTRETILKTGKA